MGDASLYSPPPPPAVEPNLGFHFRDGEELRGGAHLCASLVRGYVCENNGQDVMNVGISILEAHGPNHVYPSPSS